MTFDEYMSEWRSSIAAEALTEELQEDERFFRSEVQEYIRGALRERVEGRYRGKVPEGKLRCWTRQDAVQEPTDVSFEEDVHPLWWYRQMGCSGGIVLWSDDVVTMDTILPYWWPILDQPRGERYNSLGMLSMTEYAPPAFMRAIIASKTCEDTTPDVRRLIRSGYRRLELDGVAWWVQHDRSSIKAWLEGDEPLEDCKDILLEHSRLDELEEGLYKQFRTDIVGNIDLLEAWEAGVDDLHDQWNIAFAGTPRPQATQAMTRRVEEVLSNPERLCYSGRGDWAFYMLGDAYLRIEYLSEQGSWMVQEVSRHA